MNLIAEASCHELQFEMELNFFSLYSHKCVADGTNEHEQYGIYSLVKGKTRFIPVIERGENHGNQRIYARS